MILHCITHRIDSPSFRYRIERVISGMSTNTDIIPNWYSPEDSTKIQMLLDDVHAYANDVFIFQKINKLTPFSWLCVELARRVKYSIYDIDDALHVIREPDVMFEMAKLARCVIVSSSFLYNEYVKINKNIQLIPTPSPDPVMVKLGRVDDMLRVGWIGTYFSHHDNLQTILWPSLHQLTVPIQLCLMGIPASCLHTLSEQLNNTNVDISLIDISNWNDDASVMSNVASFDVGVSPLVDNPMNTARSAFKLKQYLAAGVPVLASPVGENIACLEHGINGYLCNSVDDWVRGIMQFESMSTSEFMQFQRNAHLSYINSNYTINNIISLYKKAIIKLFDI